MAIFLGSKKGLVSMPEGGVLFRCITVYLTEALLWDNPGFDSVCRIIHRLVPTSARHYTLIKFLLENEKKTE